MGEKITLYCNIYIYTGKLMGVNGEFVELENPYIVYETGWKDAQKLPSPHRVMRGHIESWGAAKC